MACVQVFYCCTMSITSENYHLHCFVGTTQKHSGLPKKILIAKLNMKLLGYYNYYGVTGNSKRLNSFVYQVIGLLFKWLNRRSQRKSYKWEGFIELVKCFGIAKPRILHAL